MYQAQMVECETGFGPRIEETFLSIFRCLSLSSYTDNGLNPNDISRKLRGESVYTLTWCFVSGTSTVMNWARLYSLRTGRTLSCSVSSSDIMFLTSIWTY